MPSIGAGGVDGAADVPRDEIRRHGGPATSADLPGATMGIVRAIRAPPANRATTDDATTDDATRRRG